MERDLEALFEASERLADVIRQRVTELEACSVLCEQLSMELDGDGDDEGTEKEVNLDDGLDRIVPDPDATEEGEGVGKEAPTLPII